MTAAERSDADLLRAHAAGDPYAFEELVRRHRDRLWAVALRTTRDREEAADALQDALISAYRAAGSFRGDSAVTTWLHRIVVNACLDRMRRRQARPTVPLPEEGPHEPADSRDRVAERDTAMVVEAALGQLPAEQRAAHRAGRHRGLVGGRDRGDARRAPRARSSAAAPAAGPGWPSCSATCGTRTRPRPSHRGPAVDRARRPSSREEAR